MRKQRSFFEAAAADIALDTAPEFSTALQQRAR